MNDIVDFDSILNDIPFSEREMHRRMGEWRRFVIEPGIRHINIPSLQSLPDYFSESVENNKIEAWYESIKLFPSVLFFKDRVIYARVGFSEKMKTIYISPIENSEFGEFENVLHLSR